MLKSTKEHFGNSFFYVCISNLRFSLKKCDSGVFSEQMTANILLIELKYYSLFCWNERRVAENSFVNLLVGSTIAT